MQNPIDFGKTLLRDQRSSSMANMLREYLQVLALKIIYQSEEGLKLGFGGGTALRICYNLPRYSVDLDFELAKKHFNLDKFVEDLKSGFVKFNTAVDISVPSEAKKKTVIKLWLKFPKILETFNLSSPGEKLNIKIEIDTKPPRNSEYESLYIDKFKEYFPVVVGTLQTLFASKIGAIVKRKYTAPRDFYDLIWYLNKGIEPNYKVLKDIHIANVSNPKSLIKLVDAYVKKVPGDMVLKAIRTFLENSSEKIVLKDFQNMYNQAKKKYLS